MRGQSEEEPGLYWNPYSKEQQSGHSGPTSKAAEPSRRLRIEEALIAVMRSGKEGLTWKEFADQYHLHHGMASSALSNLHRSGSVARLAESRGGSGIYVLKDKVDGRDTIRYRSNKQASIEQAGYRIAAKIDKKRQEITPTADLHYFECWKVHPRCALLLAMRIASGEEEGEK